MRSPPRRRVRGSPVDASVDDAGAADDLDASNAPDTSGPTPVAYAFQGCPPSPASALPTPWCADNPGAGGVSGSCAGYVALGVYGGSNEANLFLYPADGGPLAAILAVGNLHYSGCVAGSADFELPSSCFGAQGLELLRAFNGPGAEPGCAGYDAGPPGASEDASSDAGPEAAEGDDDDDGT